MTNTFIEACPILGYFAPKIELIPHPLMEGMYDVTGIIESATHCSHIGPIRNVFGKKKAKEDASKAILKALELIAAERQRITFKVTGKLNFTYP